MINYKIDTMLTIEIDGEEKVFDYSESGSSLSEEIGEALDMFVKPRFEADGYILVKRAKETFLA